MNSNRQIRKKVAQLRKDERKTGSKIVQSMYSLVLLAMCCAAVILTQRIALHGGFDPLISLWDSFSETLNLTELKQWVFLEKWLNDEVQAVSSVSYHHISDHLYESDNHEVISVDDGIVIYTGEQDSGKVIMIHQDNGLIVTYGLLNEVFASEDDRILKGTLLGKCENEVYLDFSWQGVSISYEEALGFEH